MLIQGKSLKQPLLNVTAVFFIFRQIYPVQDFLYRFLQKTFKKIPALTIIRNRTILVLKRTIFFIMSITKSLKHYLLLLSEIDSVYHEANLKLNISNSYSIILYTICLGGGSCPLQEIKKLSGLNKQTINSSIRNMEKENLVYLEYIDGKSKRISLTQKGQELANNTVMKIMDMENEIISRWNHEDLQKYLSMTEDFLAALKEKTAGL